MDRDKLQNRRFEIVESRRAVARENGHREGYLRALERNGSLPPHRSVEDQAYRLRLRLIELAKANGWSQQSITAALNIGILERLDEIHALMEKGFAEDRENREKHRLYLASLSPSGRAAYLYVYNAYNRKAKAERDG